jgi:hypothetical protein
MPRQVQDVFAIAGGGVDPQGQVGRGLGELRGPGAPIDDDRTRVACDGVVEGTGRAVEPAVEGSGQQVGAGR